jgi:hypothetical protein
VVDSERDAKANLSLDGTKRGERPGSSGYYLGLFNDGFYDVSDREEMRYCWLPGERINWAKGYVEGNLEVVLRLCIKGCGEIADLVFSLFHTCGRTILPAGSCSRRMSA